MNIFVTGETGAAGQHTVQTLVSADHNVSSMVRTDGKVALIKKIEAKPVALSLFDKAACGAATAATLESEYSL